MCVHVCVSVCVRVCVCLCAWQRHFAEVLNVQKKAAEEVLSELEDHSHGETDEMSSRESSGEVTDKCSEKVCASIKCTD